MNPNAIVAYLVLFSVTGLLFVFAALLLGRFLRPYAGNSEKLKTYECGEPSVGSSHVQFDLRFYVVALVFIIFEVEVAFFFPWATVFGKATQMNALAVTAESLAGSEASQAQEALHQALDAKYRELGSIPPVERGLPANATFAAASESTARKLALAAMLDMVVFFAIVLVGFAYVWNRGDLDWVRAIGRRGQTTESPPAEITAGAVGSGTSS